MARASKHRSILSILTVAAGSVPVLPASLVVMAPAGLALAASPAGQPPQTLAQAIARGDVEIAQPQLQALILAQRQDYTLVDIRAPDAFAAGHILNARNIPLAQLGAPEQINILRRSPQVIVYADSTVAAAEAAVMLRGAGVMARALSGGITDWARSIDAAATKPDQQAIVRALNTCPEVSLAPIPAPAAASVAAPAAPAAPAARPRAPINLNGMCG